MLKEKRELYIEGQIYLAEVDIPQASDKDNLLKMYNLWKELSEQLNIVFLEKFIPYEVHIQ